MAYHVVARVGSRVVLLGRAGNAELILGNGPIEGEGRAGDPLAVEAVAEGLGGAVSSVYLRDDGV